ncbi:hypothetical protein QGM61_03635 [Pseudohongiella sp. SYSU M77423]|uniref:hypothetical protein n=1 Tax=Pseudohongiella sp. SYSU M77423 TaxID=3042312 RepID=UPI002480E97D|nr:hypothetical protein [Pseudohongiella sp. SYSU M77423]MDH7942904.1 hypothetical protein [Pseudohongiella sp. SYSU M77423]
MSYKNTHQPLKAFLSVVALAALLAACSQEQNSAPQSSMMESNSAATESAPTDPTLRSIAQGELRGAVQADGSLAWRNIPYA